VKIKKATQDNSIIPAPSQKRFFSLTRIMIIAALISSPMLGLMFYKKIGKWKFEKTVASMEARGLLPNHKECCKKIIAALPDQTDGEEKIYELYKLSEAYKKAQKQLDTKKKQHLTKEARKIINELQQYEVIYLKNPPPEFTKQLALIFPSPDLLLEELFDKNDNSPKEKILPEALKFLKVLSLIVPNYHVSYTSTSIAAQVILQLIRKYRLSKKELQQILEICIPFGMKDKANSIFWNKNYFDYSFREKSKDQIKSTISKINTGFGGFFDIMLIYWHQNFHYYHEMNKAFKLQEKFLQEFTAAPPGKFDYLSFLNQNSCAEELSPLCNNLMWSIECYFENCHFLNNHFLFNIIRTVIAVELYKLDHNGKRPGSLLSLIPDYCSKEQITNPYNKKTYNYFSGPIKIKDWTTPEGHRVKEGYLLVNGDFSFTINDTLDLQYSWYYYVFDKKDKDLSLNKQKTGE